MTVVYRTPVVTVTAEHRSAIPVVTESCTSHNSLVGPPGPQGEQGPPGYPGGPIPDPFIATLVDQGGQTFNVKAYGAVGDGVTDDTAAIQAAINALPAVGGVVFLPTGIYRINAPLTVTKDSVIIEGAGIGNPFGTYSGPEFSGPMTQGGTVITASPGFSGTYMVNVATTDRALRGVHLRHFSLAGFSLPGSTSGIHFQVHKGSIQDVYVVYMTNLGIHLSSTSATWYGGNYDNILSNVRIEHSGSHGLRFTSWAGDNLITNCIINDVGANCVSGDDLSPANIFTGCYFYDATGKGIELDTFHTKIVNTRIQDCNGGIYLSGQWWSGGFTIVGCTLRNCSNATDNTTDCINVAPVAAMRGGVISACDFSTDLGQNNTTYNRARYAINIASANMMGCVIGPCSTGYQSASSALATGFLRDLGTDTTVLTGNASLVVNDADVNGVMLRMESAIPASRFVGASTAGKLRWAVGVNSTAEAGANAGSDWNLLRYDDTGAYIDAVLSISRQFNFAQFSGDVGLAGGSAGGKLQFKERTDPSAPAVNQAALYARDNGSGKTQLCVRFPTGAIQVIATEP